MSTVIKYETEVAGSESAEKHRAAHSWKQDVARRVAAHRSRSGNNRADAVAAQAEPMPETEERRRAAKIAAAVAARYAVAPTYKQMMNSPEPMSLFAVEETASLATMEMSAVLEMPQAAEPVATAVTEPPVEVPATEMKAPTVEESEDSQEDLDHLILSMKKPSASITEDEVLMATEDEDVAAPPQRFSQFTPQTMRIEMLPSPPESFSPEVLPVRVIDSPRELIAVRRMRPRMAESTPKMQPSNSQLRIFEVEPDMVSTMPEPPAATPLAAIFSEPEMEAMPVVSYPPTPEPIAREVLHWQIQEEWERQEAAAMEVRYESRAAEYVPEALPVLQQNVIAASDLQPGMRPCDRAATIVIQTAPIELRLMAMLTDLCITSGIALGGLLLYMVYAAHPMAIFSPSKLMMVAGGAAFLVLFLLYQMFCFAVSGSTPGMRYARIGLCTFDDENPTRLAMCGRALAQVLSLCPLCLGYMWAMMDMDGLSWHDRMTHMYQRGY